MGVNIQGKKVCDFHDSCTSRPGWARELPRRHESGAWKYIELNHLYNSLLWDEEDQARRRDVADSEIAANKRAIDGYNQKRQDAIERLDEELLAQLSGLQPDADARQNSETAGTMIDRLSILSLKIYHMRLQTKRTDASSEHIMNCTSRLQILVSQRSDLLKCLDRLFEDVGSGRAYFKVYRQFKMYNDPTLNPYLYQNK